MMSATPTNILQYKTKGRVRELSKANPILKLVLDDKTAVSMSDKPVFGSSVTISETTAQLVGRMLMPGVVIGWVNYVDIDKFACITDDNHYLAASEFIYTEQNQIVLAKALKIHSIDTDMNSTKEILRFSVK